MKFLVSFIFFISLCLAPRAQDTTVYDMSSYVDHKPRWQGCDSIADEKQADDCWMEEFVDFINENLEWPCGLEDVNSKIWMEFIVEVNGKPSSFKNIRPTNSIWDDEVLR